MIILHRLALFSSRALLLRFRRLVLLSSLAKPELTPIVKLKVNPGEISVCPVPSSVVACHVANVVVWRDNQTER